MAIVLQSSATEDGLQSETAFIESALLWIANPAVFAPPVLVADIRAALEAGQPVGYMVTAMFDQYLQRIYDLPIVDASLTLAERTILNNIREYLDPPPSLACCGSDLPSALNTSSGQNLRVGTGTFEYELQIKASADVTCAVDHVVVTITPGAGVPPAATVSPVTCNLLGCNSSGFTIFSKLWVDFVGSPVGGNYNLSADFKDSSGASLAVVPYAVVWP